MKAHNNFKLNRHKSGCLWIGAYEGEKHCYLGFNLSKSTTDEEAVRLTSLLNQHVTISRDADMIDAWMSDSSPLAN